MGQSCSADVSGDAGDDLFEPEACLGSARSSQMLCSALAGREKVVCAAVGKVIFAYSTSTGKKLHTLEAHDGPVTCLTAHGTWLFSGSVDKTVRRWDVNGARVLFTMKGHTGPVWCLVLKKDMLFSASDDKTIIRWDPLTCHKQAQFSRHEAPVRLMVNMQDFLVSGSDDCKLLCWDMKTGGIVGEIEHGSTVTCLYVVDNELWSGSANGCIQRWDVRSGDLVTSIQGHTHMVTCLLSVEGCLISGSRDRTIRRWDIETGSPVASYELGTISFKRRGGFLVGNEDGSMSIRNASDNEKFTKHDHSDGRVSLKARSGKFLGTSVGGEVTLSSDIIGAEQKFDLLENADGSVSIRTSQGYYIGECQGGGIRAARCSNETGTPEESQKFGTFFIDCHYSGVTCLLAMDGTLLSGGADRSIKLWDYDSGMVLASLEGRTGVTCLLSADGSLYAGAARGAPLRLPRPKPLMNRLQPAAQAQISVSVDQEAAQEAESPTAASPAAEAPAAAADATP